MRPRRAARLHGRQRISISLGVIPKSGARRGVGGRMMTREVQEQHRDNEEVARGEDAQGTCIQMAASMFVDDRRRGQ